VTDHVSDLQWDRLLAGDLSAVADNAAHAHAARCAACASRLRELTAERDAFWIRWSEVPRSRARRRRWPSALVPLAAAAAAAALIALRVRPREGDSGERPKGSILKVPSPETIASHGPALLLSAGRPDALPPVASGDVVHPGDYLQAGYTATRDGFGAVLSRDGVGSVTAYVPPGGDAMVPLAAGVERSFPQSTILDATLGGERIVIVWCETEHPFTPLLAALRADRPISAPGDCVVREVTLEKRAATTGSDPGTTMSDHPAEIEPLRATWPPTGP